MHIRKGTMYAKKKIQKAKKILLMALEREGYINSIVEVEVEKIGDTSVSITFQVNKGEKITIVKTSYIGAKKLSIKEIESVIANKAKDCCFTWFFGRHNGEMNFEQLEYDSHRIKDLYLQNGYLDATVTAGFSKVDFDKNTATIEYKIYEGTQYKIDKTIIYIDEKIVKVDDILSKLRLEKDDIFNINYLREDQKIIKTLVSNKGYAYSLVNYDIKPNKETKTLDIIYNVTGGDKVYINDVIISGNSRTLDRVIRRNLFLAPQDLYSLTDLIDSKNSLKRTGFFETVTIKEERISKNKMNLVVVVTEAPTGNLILGGGYGSYDGWMLNASINDKNIFGSGLNLGLSIDHSTKKDTINLSLGNPSINDSIYNGTFNIYKKESLIESTDIDSINGDEITLTEGASIGAGRSIGRHTRVGITYAIENVKVDYDLTDTLDSIYKTSSITPYITFNNTDDYYVPRSGIILGSSFKIAGLGGDAKYTQSSSYFKYFYSLNKLIDKDWIIRYKTSLKILTDKGEIPDGTTFYLGGVSSVRGYQSYAFQPEDDAVPYKKTWTNTIEVSFPLLPSAKMRWALFYDYGMIGEDKFTQIKKSGRGAVISWYSPVGPLQFIFSRAVNPDDGDSTSNFEFSLGSKF